MNRVFFFYHSHIKKYGMNDESSSGFLSCIMDWVISFVTGYNHKKYWKRREYVVNKIDGNILKKIYYLLYIKRIDSRKLSSFGSTINGGASFSTPPHFTSWS